MISVKIILYAMSSLQSLQMFLGMQFDIVEINYHDGTERMSTDSYFLRVAAFVCASQKRLFLYRGGVAE